MIQHKKSLCFYIIGIFLLASIQGCDKISSIFEYFSPQKAKATKPAQTIKTPPSAQSTPKQTAVIESAVLSEKTEIAENVLARVGKWTITIEEFQEKLAAIKEAVPDYDLANVQQNAMVLEELIRQQLLIQDAEKSGLAREKRIVEAIEEVRRTILVREVVAGLISGVEATNQDAETYYNENKAEFITEIQWKIREIVVETEEAAKAILIELYQGADFVERVKAVSKSKTSWNKGDLGYISEFPFPKMGNVVASLEIGNISGVFNGPDGFYIVKMEDKKGGEPQPYEEIKEDLRQWLTVRKQQEAVFNHLEEIQKTIVVDVNDTLLLEE